jgi:hypothetical protein
MKILKAFSIQRLVASKDRNDAVHHAIRRVIYAERIL